MDNHIIISVKFINNIVKDISSNINNFINSKDYQININDNIYELVKKLKPIKNDLHKFSDLLTKLKLMNNKHYISHMLHNNKNNIEQDFSNNDKFICEYSYTFINNNDFINQNICQLYTDISINTFNINLICFTDYNMIEFKICIDDLTSYLKHEIINPINVIKMSSNCIDTNILKLEKDKNTSLIKSECLKNIRKLNNIIKKESNWSEKLISTFDNESYNNNNNFDNIKNKKTIRKFITYINSYLNYNNNFCNNNINLELNNINNTDLILININHFKIILDNIFKNILGYQTELKKNSRDKIKSFSLIKCYQNNIYKLILQNYTFEEEQTHFTKNVIVNSNKNNIKTHNKGIGMQLINDLCNKNNLNWSLVENMGIIEFTLIIPIIFDKKDDCNMLIPEKTLKSEIKRSILLKKKKTDNCINNKKKNQLLLPKKMSLINSR